MSGKVKTIADVLERLRKPFDEPDEAVTWNRSEIEAELNDIADDIEAATNRERQAHVRATLVGRVHRQCHGGA